MAERGPAAAPRDERVFELIEREFAHDWTNWWAPNAACSQAMLRAAGFTRVSLTLT
mgnify:CR=1 FL=1